MGFVGGWSTSAGSSGLTRTRVRIVAVGSDGSTAAIACWSRWPISPWVIASRTSNGSAGASGSPPACWSASAPTCGPFPCVSTTWWARAMRATARAASSACAVCSGHVPRSCSRISALPPNAMTSRTPRLRSGAPDREPDRPRRPVGRVGPRVRIGGAEVDRVALLEVVVDRVDREAHRALDQQHELLAGVDHRLRAAVGPRLDVGLRARDEERPVAPGDVVEDEPLLRGVQPRALVAADDRHRPQPVGLLDEPADALAERRGDLHEARDRRRHAALLDLVDRGGGEPGAPGELLQRPAALGPGLGDLGADVGDGLLDLRAEVGWRAHRLSDAECAPSEMASSSHFVSYGEHTLWTGGRGHSDRRSESTGFRLDSRVRPSLETHSRAETIRGRRAAGPILRKGGRCGQDRPRRRTCGHRALRRAGEALPRHQGRGGRVRLHVHAHGPLRGIRRPRQPAHDDAPGAQGVQDEPGPLRARRPHGLRHPRLPEGRRRGVPGPHGDQQAARDVHRGGRDGLRLPLRVRRAVRLPGGLPARWRQSVPPARRARRGADGVARPRLPAQHLDRLNTGPTHPAPMAAGLMDRDDAIATWRRAEARIYPSVMHNPTIYEQYIAVVRAIAEELSDVRREDDLVTAWTERRDIATAVIERSPPTMRAVMDMDAVRDAAFCHRHREITRERGKEIARERLEEARRTGAEWVVLFDDVTPLGSHRLEMHVRSGRALHASTQVDAERPTPAFELEVVQ